MSEPLDQVMPPARLAALPDVEPARPSLRELFREHLDYVWRIARVFGMSPDTADDVAQEVFLIVHRRLHTFHAGGSIRAWLFGITRNVVQHQRRAYARRERNLATVEPPPPVAAPEASVELHQAAALMQEFLDRLDFDKRIVLLLADIEGLTASEIAETLDIPLGTVFSRLRAARLKLERFSQRIQVRDLRRPL